MQEIQIETTSWNNIKGDIEDLNPELFDIIEEINPKETLPLYLATYPYGIDILDDGTLGFYCNKNKVIRLNTPDCPNELNEQFNYAAIPLGISLDKCCEVYIKLNQRVVPLTILQKGIFFGLFEVLTAMVGQQPVPVWSICSGSKSSFLLNRISDNIAHRRLRKELGINVDVPRSLKEHNEIFKQINNAQPINKKWNNRILLFSKDWFKEINNNPHWIKLKNYLLMHSWRYAQKSVNEKALSILWEKLANTISEKRLKPRQYLVDTIKHLYYIGHEYLPGFKLAINENLLPLNAVEDAYQNIYSLKDYAPTIMEASMLNKLDESIYYFMVYPTLLAGSPSSRGTPSILLDLRDIRTIITSLEKKLVKTYDRHYSQLFSSLSFEYYHIDQDPFEEILKCTNLIAHDESFKNFLKKFPGKKFPLTSSLMPGVIRIKREV